MSLLDDVSIVVTPNGYKAGELYAVIPVPTEGAELVTNGDFDSDLTGWTGYGTTSATGGVATIGASANSGILQGILTEGVRYTVTVNVTSYNGVGTAQFVNNNGNNLYTITETGIQTFTFISTIASSNLILRGVSNALFSVSSISVKEYTAADMDVTRATAATRVDENGLVNYAEVIGGEEVTNGDFATDSDWGKFDGTTISSGAINFNVTTTGTKANQTNVMTSGLLYKVTFEILNYVGGNIYMSGWSIPLAGRIEQSNGVFSFYAEATSSTFTIGTTSSSTQLSIGNISVKEVTRDNVPRIDYTGGGCPHILAEPQRTNLVTYSEYYTVYSLTRTTITSGYGTSPNGGQNSTAIFNTATTGGHNLNGIYFSVTSGTSYVNSVFAKAGTITKMKLRLFSGGGTLIGFNDGVFDLTNGTATGVGASIESYGNGWYRCYMVDSPTSSVSNARFNIGLLNADGDSNYTGLITDYIEVFGSEVSVGSYATSYIPTSGSTVTRNQDIFTRDGIGSLINSTEGVLFAEIAALANDVTNRSICLSDGTSVNRILFRYEGSNIIRAFVLSGGTIYVNFTFTHNNINNLKFAIKWKVNDFAFWVNGNEVLTDASGNAPIGLNRLALDNGSGTQDFYGKVKQLQVYDTALTDEQLLQLTGESGTDFYESYAEMASALTYTIQ